MLIIYLPIMFKKWTSKRQINFICNTSEGKGLIWGSGTKKKTTHIHFQQMTSINPIMLYTGSTVWATIQSSIQNLPPMYSMERQQILTQCLFN